MDSQRLLAALEEEASRQRRSPAILLEVNMTRDPAKHGFAPEDVPALAPHLLSLRHLQVRGLMTMAAYEENPEHCRSTFAALRALRDESRKQLGSNAELRAFGKKGDSPPKSRSPFFPNALSELSMGMSNDFEIAVEEGATLVRRALFSSRALERHRDRSDGTCRGLRIAGACPTGCAAESGAGGASGPLKVAVTAPPEDGRANKALAETLRDALDLKRSQVELLSGATSRDKRFLIRGLSARDLLGRLVPIIG